MTRLIGIVTVRDLRLLLDHNAIKNDDELKVEINDTMETRLVIVPNRSDRMAGRTRFTYFAIPSYEAGE